MKLLYCIADRPYSCPIPDNSAPLSPDTLWAAQGHQTGHIFLQAIFPVNYWILARNRLAVQVMRHGGRIIVRR